MTFLSRWLKRSRPAESALKVKLIGIAKDESAYLPEWLFHHLYFGFDAIEVLVNRTSDNSYEMLECLQSIYPTLTYSSCDWVDWLPDDGPNGIQFIAYSAALNKEQERKEFDYIMFLDIDEFWTPKDMSSSIQSYLYRAQAADTVSFQWLNQHGNNESFLHLSDSVFGQLSPLVKTATSTSASIQKMSLHFPAINNGRCVLENGESYIADSANRECLHTDLVCVRDAMIVHRMFRSPMEYLSMLSKGRPSDNFSIKLNRGGYNNAKGQHCEFKLDNEGFSTYETARRVFFEHSELSNLLAVARAFVMQRANHIHDNIMDMPFSTVVDLLAVFKGCDDKVVNHILNRIYTGIDVNESVNREYLIKLATELQSLDGVLAKKVLDLAIR